MAEQDRQQQREKLLLSHWGLPKPVLAAFANKGLTELYPWQAAALECAAAGNNLVYCAPTSGEACNCCCHCCLWQPGFLQELRDVCRCPSHLFPDLINLG
jgi:hypothetical protein